MKKIQTRRSKIVLLYILIYRSVYTGLSCRHLSLIERGSFHHLSICKKSVCRLIGRTRKVYTQKWQFPIALKRRVTPEGEKLFTKMAKAGRSWPRQTGIDAVTVVLSGPTAIVRTFFVHWFSQRIYGTGGRQRASDSGSPSVGGQCFPSNIKFVSCGCQLSRSLETMFVVASFCVSLATKGQRKKERGGVPTPSLTTNPSTRVMSKIR